ncbi:Glucanosyltransferase-domain-containing protein [Diplogelasinospora grovesii]|uniref:1,3-beta-glucanosyltransferase n=1 Tax=Diplogelasinospora grovesii TaxID=303347 RepID=A0AAN6NIZ6_9PEZI|nr:Glucanosyltransferase-domain-containing protein [Diplogelasinospora grovesii]
MKSFAFASALAAISSSLVTATPTPTDPEQPHKRATLPTVTASGNAFWTGSTRFYVRGIDYQPGGSSAMADPLADSTICQRDIAEFKKLGVNTIRVYITDNSANHDTCMNALADAGIYVIIDANNPLYSINRFEPAASYNTAYLQSVFATIDEFIKYPNTMAFFSGNEVINDNVTSTLSARYVKATTRDMRQYIGNRGYRKVPVGYSAADVSQNRIQLASYMNCGTDDERSDFFAFNDYSWCNTNFVQSGWDQKVKSFTGYGIPIFLSEYGCITNGRDFGEVQALMSSEMTGVYSGGLMYEYALEANNFGIVKIPSPQASTVQEEAGFTKFASAMSAYPAPTGNGGFTSTTNSAACPTKDANWLVDSTLLPAIPDGAKAFMTAGAGTGPGLKGDGSQNAGGTSTGDASPGSGTSTAAPSSSKNAAGVTKMGPIEKAPLIITGLVFVLTLTGTMLL